MARNVVVQYKVKANRVEEHEALIRDVFSELRRTAPEGIRYGAFKRADGLSFVHVAFVSAEKSPLDSLPAFQRFAERIKARRNGRNHGNDRHRREGGPRPRPPKAARGRVEARTSLDASTRAKLDRYACLFNQRDWDGVRALVGDECELDLISRSQRRGKEVGLYFDRYEKADVSLRVVRLEGDLALAALVSGATQPSYFILLDWEGDRVNRIRDFRYVPYIAVEAEFET